MRAGYRLVAAAAAIVAAVGVDGTVPRSQLLGMVRNLSDPACLQRVQCTNLASMEGGSSAPVPRMRRHRHTPRKLGPLPSICRGDGAG